VTGKLLLAFGGLPLDRLGPEPYERFTERTLTTSAELAREVDRVRSEGVAYGREEREHGLNAVGAPILGREQALVAMLSIQAPASRLPVRRMPDLASLLRESANVVGAALGGQSR
jgi:DNA-binding IclR family transcriptional regulator